MRKNLLCVCAASMALWLGCAGAFAFGTDDVIKLSKAGFSDDVIISQVAAQRAVFNLSTDDIIGLKAAGVSDKVIAFMVQTRLAAEQAAQAEAQSRVETSRQAVTGAQLAVTNRDDQTYSVMVDGSEKKIFVFFGDSSDRICLTRNATAEFVIPAGVYTVKWVGESESFAFGANDGDRCDIVLSRINTASIDALGASILVDGRQVTGGIIKMFSERVIVVREPEPVREVVVYRSAPPVCHRQVEFDPLIFPALFHHISIQWNIGGHHDSSEHHRPSSHDRGSDRHDGHRR